MIVASQGLIRLDTAHSLSVNAPLEASPRRLAEASRFSRPVPPCEDPAGSSFSQPVVPAGESFAHEDALVSDLGAAPGLFVPDGGVEVLILGHRLVRIEADLAVAAPHRFRLRKGQQPPAQS